MPVAPQPKLGPWTRARREVVADFGIFAVERGPYVRGGGQLTRDVHTFRCRDWCNVIPVTRDGHIILIWQYRFGTDAFSLEVPGGVIDEGEAPEHAAARELQEECGYRATRIEHLSTLQPNPALQGNVIHSYIAWDAEPFGETNFDELEECEAVRIPLARLGELLDGGEVQHALCAVALEAFLRRVTRRSTT
jgi:8-oxo-dGTP pyrophosphatase MutT (NUDIX family)